MFSSLAFQLIPGFLPEDLIQAMSLDNGKLISALIGAVISGTGVGIVIAQGGSTEEPTLSLRLLINTGTYLPDALCYGATW